MVAFGRAVQDDLAIYGGGKMKLLMAMSEGRTRMLHSAGGGLPSPNHGVDAREMQLERSAAVIQGQVEFPVSLDAAKAALKKVSGGGEKGAVHKLISSRGSPSPKNYLQQVRDQRNHKNNQESSGYGHRPKTAPTVTTLKGKWLADDFLQ